MHAFFAKYLKFAVLMAALCGLATAPVTHAAEKNEFKVAWSIYVGWMPWDYANKTGILKKWADKYGIKIDLVQINDYIESINQYTAGLYDGCSMTNMDALSIPAGSGIDTTALIIGDFSNGNDGIILKGTGKKLTDIKGQRVNLVELSVSHYLLARGLQSVGLSERDVKTVNTSDADIVSAYGSSDVTAVVTWNPQLSVIRAMPDNTEVFNSSQIPGEIIDMTVIKTDLLKKDPRLAKALVGAWYETMALMTKEDAKATAARTFMAKASGTDLKGYDSQLKTTAMFYKPAAAVKFTDSPDLIKTMDYVRKFSFEHGILGEGAKSPDAVGMLFPGGKTLGDTKNIKLRFTSEYMALAAHGKL